jgi:hypothetical protein
MIKFNQLELSESMLAISWIVFFGYVPRVVEMVNNSQGTPKGTPLGTYLTLLVS